MIMRIPFDLLFDLFLIAVFLVAYFFFLSQNEAAYVQISWMS